MTGENKKPPNPVTRDMLRELFSDGEWWTTDGMAAVILGKSIIPEHVIIRFFQAYRDPTAVGGHANYIKSIKMMIQKAFGTQYDTFAEMRGDGAKRLFRLKTKAKVKLRATRPVPAVDIKSSESTWSGLSVALVVGVLQQHGPLTLDELVVLLSPFITATDAELVKRYRKATWRKNDKRDLDAPFTADDVAKAKRSIIYQKSTDVMDTGLLEMRTVVHIRLKETSHANRSDADRGTGPAVQPKKTV